MVQARPQLGTPRPTPSLVPSRRYLRLLPQSRWPAGADGGGDAQAVPRRLLHLPDLPAAPGRAALLPKGRAPHVRRLLPGTRPYRTLRCPRDIRGVPASPASSPHRLQATLEKCAKCQGLITERIVRAMGKGFHPSCFACTACGRAIGAESFAVDERDEVYCVADFYR